MYISILFIIKNNLIDKFIYIYIYKILGLMFFEIFGENLFVGFIK